MVEVSHLRFDRDFKNVFQQILNRECLRKKLVKLLWKKKLHRTEGFHRDLGLRSNKMFLKPQD